MKDPFPLASRPALRSVPDPAATPVRPPPRDQAAVITKQGDDDEGTVEFIVGQHMFTLAEHGAKLDALAEQNKALGLQGQKVAGVMVSIAGLYLANMLGAGPVPSALAFVGLLVLLVAFPQFSAILVGRVPLLADLIAKAPQTPASASAHRPTQSAKPPPPKGPQGAA
jgi:hypothetical protein